ncbi:OmpA family protein [Rhodobacteraceae bacterium]|nr:OmpA family protein [Paracoccaceae bacterium]
MLLVLCWPLSLFAGPVVLTNADGSVTVEGELVSFDGEFFRVDTAFGPLTLDAGNLQCSGVGCPDPVDLIARSRVAGPAGMIHRLMPPLIEVFADREGFAFRSLFLSDSQIVWELREPATGQLVAVFEGAVQDDSDVAQGLAAGDIDIALSKTEQAAPVRQDVIALDAVVPLVPAENPRALVTQSQLSSLLSGRLGRWSQLDGPDLPVVVHVLDGARGPLARWYSGRMSQDAFRYDSADALADAVAADPAAVGLGLFSAMGNATPLVVGGTCGLAIPATRDSIRAEDYPLTQPLFLHRLGTRQPKIVRDFIAFVRSEEAQPVIATSGYVDQAIGRIGFERQGDRIANAVLAAGDDDEASEAVRDMVGALLNLDRLTLTFRFQDGSSDLDAQSASNVHRLADVINQGEFDGKRVHFIGFTDGVGPSDGNMRLSDRRARSVRRAVAARVDTAPVDMASEGFGEVLPMACDDTAWGRQVNRRVEVWID